MKTLAPLVLLGGIGILFLSPIAQASPECGELTPEILSLLTLAGMIQSGALPYAALQIGKPQLRR